MMHGNLNIKFEVITYIPVKSPNMRQCLCFGHIDNTFYNKKAYFN